MKKVCVLLVLFCFLLAGCSNEFARAEYDSEEKIAKVQDRYAKTTSTFKQINEGLELTVTKFDGRETLWTEIMEESQSMKIDCSFSISEGRAKLVHVDETGKVTTIMECTPETSTENLVTQTVALSNGINRIKIVGYDCRNVKLKIQFPE